MRPDAFLPPMADNRQIAYGLALASGIVSLAFTAFFLLVLAGVGVGFAWLLPGGGPEAFLFGVFALLFLANLVVGVATGVLMLVAAPRLRSEDEAMRRAWSTWSLVIGIVNVLTGGLIAGALALGAGVVTFMDLQRPAPPVRAS